MDLKISECNGSNKDNLFVDVLRYSMLSDKVRGQKFFDAIATYKVCAKNGIEKTGFSLLCGDIQSVLNSKLNEGEDSYFEIKSENGKIGLFEEKSGKIHYSQHAFIENGGFCVLNVSKGIEFRNGLKGNNGLKKVSSIIEEILNELTIDEFVDVVHVAHNVKTCAISKEFRNYVVSFVPSASNLKGKYLTYNAIDALLLSQWSTLKENERDNYLLEIGGFILNCFRSENKEAKIGGKTNEIKNELMFILRGIYESRVNSLTKKASSKN